MKKLSVVVPSYNEEANLDAFYAVACDAVSALPIEVEYVFVDDGSRDGTLRVLRQLAEAHSNVHYLSFSRNFGKEAAILAGLRFASGDAVVLLDADLQHPPSLIPKMWGYFEEGYDQVIAKRNRTGEQPLRRGLTNVYYRLINRLVEVKMTDGVGDFRLLSRRALEALLQLTEYNRFSKGLFSWIGFKEVVFDYENQQRHEGTSKWRFSDLLNYGIDGIISFNNRPLRFAIYGGMFVTSFGFLYILFSLVSSLVYGVETPGYFTTISAIILLGGIQLLFLGIIGEYIGRIYYETKQRPHYLVQEDSRRLRNGDE